MAGGQNVEPKKKALAQAQQQVLCSYYTVLRRSYCTAERYLCPTALRMRCHILRSDCATDIQHTLVPGTCTTAATGSGDDGAAEDKARRTPADPRS
eukprot:2105700-Rhodomonas_salina.1